MRSACKAIDEEEIQTEPRHMPQYERSYAFLSKQNICGDTPENPTSFKLNGRAEDDEFSNY